MSDIKTVFVVGIDDEGGIHFGVSQEILEVIGNPMGIVTDDDMENMANIVEKINDAVGEQLDAGTQNFLRMLEKGELK